MTTSSPTSSSGIEPSKSQSCFSLKEVEACIRGLEEISVTVPIDQRITAQKVHTLGAIRLGTMMIGSPEMYCTDHHSVLGRCHLPYTNGMVWYEGQGGLEHQHSSVVDLHRLQNIKQLSLLAFPVIQSEHSHAMDFRHTRFLHTYDVIAQGLLCAHNVRASDPSRISQKDLTALTVALVIHDVFTAACGDLMKFVDYERFDEDLRLSTLLTHEPYLHMCGELEINPAEPIRICQEKDGTLCQIRDFADTLAYTARDLTMFLEFFGMMPPEECAKCYEDPEDQMLLQEIYELRQDKSDFALLWENIETDKDGNLVFSNPERLKTFLRVRAIMFRILYYNRQTRNVEYLLGIRMVKILLEKGILNFDQFLGDRSDENSIWWKIYQTTGYNPSFLHNGALGMTYEFNSLELAQRYIKEMSSDSACGLIYKWPSATKSKVNYWKIKTQDGSAPWGTVFQEDADEIERLMWLHHGYHVVIIAREHLHNLKPEYWHQLKRLELNVL